AYTQSAPAAETCYRTNPDVRDMRSIARHLSGWVRVRRVREQQGGQMRRRSHALTTAAFLVCALLGVADAQGDARGNNIALGMTARQSSTYEDWSAERAVDGVTDGNAGRRSVSHTQNDPQAWWEVDLGQSYEIDEIEIWNRTDGYSERL